MRVGIFIILSIAVLLLFGAIAYILCIAAGGTNKDIKDYEQEQSIKREKGVPNGLK